MLLWKRNSCSTIVFIEYQDRQKFSTPAPGPTELFSYFNQIQVTNVTSTKNNLFKRENSRIFLRKLSILTLY